MKYFFYIFFTIITVSCTTSINSIFKDYELTIDKNKKQELQSIIEDRNPVKLKITERAVITINEKQYDFIVITVFENIDKFRTLFLTDMGNTVLDFIYSEDTLNIITNLAGIPENIILKGFCTDLRHINFSMLSSLYNTSLYSKNGQFLLTINDNNYNELFFFNTTGNIFKSIYSKRNRIISESTYHIQNKEAANIYITNYKFNYTAHVSILKAAQFDDTERVFNIQPAN